MTSDIVTDQDYGFAVWGTQGGGLVRYIQGVYIFVEAPAPGTGLGVGDEMPDEWGIAPANTLARQEDEDPDLPDDWW